DLPEKYSASDDIVHDCNDKLLTPGLIDCHTHLVYAGNRAEEFERRLQGVSYAEISCQGGGIMSTVNATRAVTETELIDQSRPRLQALMAEGVTTVEIKSGYGLNTETEIKMLRSADRLTQEFDLRSQRTFLGAHALPTEYANRSDDYIDLVCTEMLPAAVDAGVVDAVDAFCDYIGFSVKQVEKVFDIADQFSLPIKCHAEQLSNLQGAVMSASRCALSVDHLEYLAAEDVSDIADAGSVAVLLPGAFYVLKETQLPPLASLRDHQVPIALATDCNPGSSPVFSPLLIMNMGCTLFGMTPLETLAGFTINAAKALGFDDQIGSIAAGKKADLALWDCHHPAELSYHIGLNPCIDVMQNGQWREHTS
ncbi:MAG: imidazolonepropionase, partial [Gammaproteobacteria bacterium]